MFRIEVKVFKSAKWLEAADKVQICVVDDTRGYPFVSWVGEVHIARKAWLMKLAKKALCELEESYPFAV